MTAYQCVGEKLPNDRGRPLALSLTLVLSEKALVASAVIVAPTESSLPNALSVGEFGGREGVKESTLLQFRCNFLRNRSEHIL